MLKRKEGFIDVTGGKVWYEIVGDSRNIPLVTLHGGPGYPHDYLQPLEDLANQREIIFYDQLGCGNSEKSKKKSLWTVDRYVKELGEIIKALNLNQYHILGHSWGTGLAVAFALTKPKGLKSLILSDPYISTLMWEKDVERIISKLPAGTQKLLRNGDTKSKEYKKAKKEYYYNFVFRMDPLPVAILKSEHKTNTIIYRYMWGPEEYKATGTLIGFDLTGKLSEIKVPVLLLCGRFDEATPESAKYFQSLFSNARIKVFENSAHFPFWNERKDYIKTVEDFLFNA